jgi:hypothetical protein
MGNSRNRSDIGESRPLGNPQNFFIRVLMKMHSDGGRVVEDAAHVVWTGIRVRNAHDISSPRSQDTKGLAKVRRSIIRMEVFDQLVTDHCIKGFARYEV